MKLAIIGSRSFENYNLLHETLESRYSYYSTTNIPDYKLCIPIFSEVVSGGANGADKLSAKWVKEYNKNHGEVYNVKLTELIPDWNLYGKSAGFLRNTQIIEAADEVLAFWDGLSRGTADSLSKAKKLKKNTYIVYF